jgi:hypothetical protein
MGEGIRISPLAWDIRKVFGWTTTSTGAIGGWRVVMAGITVGITAGIAAGATRAVAMGVEGEAGR